MFLVYGRKPEKLLAYLGEHTNPLIEKLGLNLPTEARALLTAVFHLSHSDLLNLQHLHDSDRFMPFRAYIPTLCHSVPIKETCLGHTVDKRAMRLLTGLL